MTVNSSRLIGHDYLFISYLMCKHGCSEEKFSRTVAHSGNKKIVTDSTELLGLLDLKLHFMV